MTNFALTIRPAGRRADLLERRRPAGHNDAKRRYFALAFAHLLMYHIWYMAGSKQPDSVSSATPLKKVPAIFYKTEAGGEPVREWLRSLNKDEKRAIGEDIKTVELGWPIGMPLTKHLGNALHEVRTQLPGNRIARVIFYVDKHQRMVLLHGFVKKTRKISAEDLDLARTNQAKHERGLK